METLVNKILKHRQTVKSYSSQVINDKDWRQILDTIYWSPTSHGFEPYRVIVIDREKNHQFLHTIRPLMWNQSIVTKAAKLVFFVSLSRSVFMSNEWLENRVQRRLSRIANKVGDELKTESLRVAEFVRSTHLEVNEKNGDEWAMKQAYIALGMSMFAASILEIGSTPIEGFEREKLEAFLQKENLITSTERIAVACAFGYPESQSSYAHRGSGTRVRDEFAKKITEI